MTAEEMRALAEEAVRKFRETLADDSLLDEEIIEDVQTILDDYYVKKNALKRRRRIYGQR